MIGKIGHDWENWLLAGWWPNCREWCCFSISRLSLREQTTKCQALPCKKSIGNCHVCWRCTHACQGCLLIKTHVSTDSGNLFGKTVMCAKQFGPASVLPIPWNKSVVIFVIGFFICQQGLLSIYDVAPFSANTLHSCCCIVCLSPITSSIGSVGQSKICVQQHVCNTVRLMLTTDRENLYNLFRTAFSKPDLCFHSASGGLVPFFVTLDCNR